MRNFRRKLAGVAGAAICGVAYGVLMMAGSPIGCTGTSSSSPVCGDGFVAGTEACDDANTLAGDGCSSTCEIESGWTCTGIPSRCQRTCKGLCSAPKIVREVDYWGSCGNLPAMAFSYNEGDCVRVQPKFGGVSASSKRVTCSLGADGYWYAHITKYSDWDCSVPTGTLDTKANNRCLSDSDPEDKGSTFQCVGAVPVLCNAAYCLNGGACIDGLPGPTCDCPPGTVPPRCTAYPSTKVITLDLYTTPACGAGGEAPVHITSPEADCFALPEGVSFKAFIVSGGILLQGHLDSACSEPFTYTFTVQPDKCVRIGNYYWKMHYTNPCDNWQCLNGGQCLVVEGAPQCNCPAGVTGPHCEDTQNTK